MRSDDSSPESVAGPAADRDGDEYLLTPALSQRLDLIRHLIDFSRQILLVVGEEGSGKTSLLNHLSGDVPDNWRVAKLGGQPMGGAAVVIDALAAAFGLNLEAGDDFERRRAGILSYLQSARQALLVPVIFVDDAHLLPADALLLLLQLAQADGEIASLRVVLFCDPRIDRMLSSPQLQVFKHSILHKIEIPPFTEDDTASYLLRFAAGGNAPSEARARELHGRSGGLPGRINALMENGLETNGDTQNTGDSPGPRIQFRYAAAGAAVALAIGAGLWAWRQSDRAPAPPVTLSPAVTPPATGVTPPAVTPPTIATPPAAAPTPAVEPARPPPSPPKPAAAAAPPAVAPKPPEPPPQPPPPPPPVAETPAPTARTEPPKAAAVKPTVRPRPHEAPGGIKGDAWILEQPKNHFALQLFGSHERTAAVNFAKTYRLDARSAIYTTALGKKRLYVVIYGSYRSRSVAAAAVATLPPQVRILKPFPRSFAEIHRLMARKP